MSQTAAFYLDPLRDIYEVGNAVPNPENAADYCSLTGLHYIYLLSTSHKFHRW